MINLCDFNFIDPLLNDSQNTKENENPNSCIESLDEVADVNAGFKNLSTQSSQNQRIASKNKMPDELYEREKAECLQSFPVIQNNVKENFVRCKICIALPNIVKLHNDNRKLPPMTTEAGTRSRRTYIEEHFLSKYHKECKMAIQIPTNAPTRSSIDIHINKANSKMISHVSKLMFDVYVDAKKLTNSAYSWPSRYVAAEAGRSFQYENPSAATIPSTLNLQYVNPPTHAQLLSTIVNSDKDRFKEILKTAIACSIRIDGSVDRVQIDKIYIMLKILKLNGVAELLLLGVGEQTERGSKGLFEAVKSGIISNIGEEMYKSVMLHISSICTDGTNGNKGDKRSLWVYFEEEKKKIGSEMPLVKIWYSAHRLELVWGDVCKAHAVINKTLSEVSSMSSHFRLSALRTSALKKVATENNFDLLSLPKLFTIRWTEFSATIIENVLRSWRALVTYFQINKDVDCTDMGYFNFLTKVENLRIMSFLGDLLHIFSRHQLRLQSDKLTIVSLMESIHSLENSTN